MKIKLTLLLAVVSICGVYAQKQLNWKDLADVSFVTKYVESEGGEVLIPEFGTSIKNMEGKQISVTGYFLNLDATSKSYMLSKNPMSACFFCGAGGPETVIEIHFKGNEVFKTDAIVTITGVLKLNQTDLNHCNYIMEQATGVSMQ